MTVPQMRARVVYLNDWGATGYTFSAVARLAEASLRLRSAAR